MIPSTYSMINLGGIDLADIVGRTFEGIYNTVLSGLSSTKIEIFYNWYFSSIIIPPSYVTIDDSVPGVLTVNNSINIYSDDTISVIGVVPSVEPITISENGTYNPPSGVAGYSPVIVSVPPPVLTALTVLQNGTYTPETGYDGFSSVTVDVMSGARVSPVYPTSDVGAVGDYYIYLAPLSPTEYLIKIDVCGRASDYTFTYWGARNIRLIFDDGEGNEVNIYSIPNAKAYWSSGGTFSQKNALINGSTTTYNETSGLPGYIRLQADIPATYTPKRLEVYARSNTNYHDFWRTFSFGSCDSAVDPKLIQTTILQETDLTFDDWGYDDYTSFSLGPLPQYVPYLYQKTQNGWVLIK